LGGVMLVLVWLVLSVTMWRTSWQQFQLSRYPEHANRILYWLLALALIFVGEGFLFFLDPILNTIGQATRLVGVFALTTAVSSYRLIDVRTRAQRAFAMLVVVIVSAIPATAILLLLQWLAEQTRWEYFTLLTFVVVVLTFMGYQTFRRFIERLIFRYFIGQEFDTSNVVRRYSQAISRTLDVNELSLVIIRIISDILATSRGALILVSEEGNQATIEPVPGMGDIDDTPVTFPRESRLLQALRYERKPLQQYDLDFNPDFRDLGEPERNWLHEQSMALFVPIHSAGGLAGIIALGPKRTGLIYRPNEMDLLQILADQTVVALQNARLYSELGKQNETNRQLNIDLRKQNERLEIMDQAKADFIAIASHELRTPLTQVKGYADILDAMNEENMLTREQTRAIIGHVNRATTQLENLVSAMLDASQLDVDSMQLTFMPTQLDTVFRLAVDPLYSAMRERRVQLKLEGIEDIPQLQLDFKRIVQAFQNLIGNAVKYTPDGGYVTVTAALVPSQAGDNDYVEIVVSDSGIGIDEKYHSLIFEKFFRIGDSQLHSTGSTKFMGAGPGLGLPITKGVIEAHGGRVWVESEGESKDAFPGSHFHVILPLKQPVKPVEKVMPADQPANLIQADS
ncbi:MAG: HAMP domain-containing histidine kinase, partial [Anaerolineales bacterium]|nr:HAMP domain-containing histidine kinase [Anaerolineales bacterium]